jgi:tetratricopeptide (TPR) repeat protein
MSNEQMPSRRTFRAICDLALICVEIGDLKQAKRQCDRLAEILAANSQTLNSVDKSKYHFVRGALQIKNFEDSNAICSLSLAQDLRANEGARSSELDAEIALLLGESELRAGGMDRGASQIEMALSLIEEHISKRNPLYARGLCSMAMLANELGQHDEEARLLVAAKDNSNYAIGYPHRERSGIMFRIARLCERTGDWRNAEQALTLALPAAIESGHQLRQAEILSMQASIRIRFQNFGRADELLRNSSELLESIVDTDHPYAIRNLFHLSVIAYRTGQYPSAVSGFERSREIMKQRFGANNLWEARVSAYLGACYLKTEQIADARESLTKAVDLFEGHSLSPDEAYTLARDSLAELPSLDRNVQPIRK